MDQTTSISTELATDTRPVVECIRQNPGVSVAQTINSLTATWGEVVRRLFVVSGVLLGLPDELADEFIITYEEYVVFC